MLNNGRNHSIGAENSHLVEYHLPVTSTISPFTNNLVTVISFFVSVPVLSVQMIFTLHNVSTEDKRLTSTFFFTNLLTPNWKKHINNYVRHKFSGYRKKIRKIYHLNDIKSKEVK
jgi:hypothetical protein